MTAVSLLFVGIVLINNGIGTLKKCDAKAMSVMNFLTGGLSVFINMVSMVQGNYYAAATGLLFGFTYIFVGVNLICNFDNLLFSWFSTFVAVNAFTFGTFEGFIGIPSLHISPDWRWGVIWYLWGVLWGTSLVEGICKKSLGRFTPCLQVAEGVVTAWIPAILLLTGLW